MDMGPRNILWTVLIGTPASTLNGPSVSLILTVARMSVEDLTVYGLGRHSGESNAKDIG